LPHASSELLRLLREVTRTFPDPTLVLDLEGRILHLNPATTLLTGCGEEEATGVSMGDLLIVERDRALLRTSLDQARAGEPARPVEAHLRGIQEQGRPVIWHISRVEGEDGRPGAFLVSGADLSALRNLQAQEEALRASEARFSGIVAMASDAIISIDGDHRIVLFNRGAELIFGYTAEEILGEHLDRLLPARSRDAHRRHVEAFGSAQVPARRMAERQSIQGVRKNGEEFPAEASILKLATGDERRFTVMLRDASDRVRHERGQAFLSHVSEMLARTMDRQDPLGVVADLSVESVFDVCLLDVADDAGEDVRRVEARHRDRELAPVLLEFLEGAEGRPRNPRLQRVVDEGTPLLLGEADPVLLRQAFGEGAEAGLLARVGIHSVVAVPLQARGRRFGVLLGARRGDGEGKPRAGDPFRHRPLDSEDLELAMELGRRVGVAVDNVRLYREARRALEARDEVLGAVSHDLGNPLQAIFIGLEAMERSRPGRAEGRPGQEEFYLTAIRRSAEVMERLIQDLLEVRRMEGGHLELDAHPRPIGPLVEEALEMLTPLARVKNIRVVNGIPTAGLPEVWVDGDRIQQVLSNLVGNAVKHTPENGEVHLTCEALSGELLVQVRDTGAGIPREDLGKVFDRFWRAGNRRGRGIGLGLAIARGIVRSHGGRIWAESEVGVGSVFSFSLPLGPPPSRPALGGGPSDTTAPTGSD